MTHSMLLVQKLVILLGSQLAAWLLRRLGQPPVVGKMIAGLAPGPLVFGALAPSCGCRPASAAPWLLPTGSPDAR
ncbi:MAG: hypothetical protein ABI870_05455 [Rhodanobacter sp.]